MSIDSIPPTVIGLGIVAILSVVIEIGYRIGKAIGRDEGLGKHPLEASVTTAILSLMAFMLGFSFASGAARQMNRKALSIEDLNASGTAYLRADFLPAELGIQSKALLREYVRVRSEIVTSGDADKIAPAIERSSEIQAELWKIAVEAREVSDSRAINLFVTAVNDLIDTDAKRQSVALANRFPAVLWLTLAFLGVLSTTMLGVSSGLHGRRSRIATTALIVAFSVVVVLIVDLDRPIRSLIKVSNPAVEQTIRSMEE